MSEIANLIKLIVSIIISIIIFYFITKYYIPYFIISNEDHNEILHNIITSGNNRKINVALINGVISLSSPEIVFDTANIRANNYVNIPPPLNNEGITYTFWLKKLSSSEYANRIILLKGNKNSPVYSPMIMFGNNSKELIVKFNTQKKQNNKIVFDSTSFGLIDGNNWYLISIVFKDYKNPTIGGFSTGLRILLYINGSLVDGKNIFEGDFLKFNNFPLYIMPNVRGKENYNLRGMLADVTYSNYEMEQIEIMNIFANIKQL